MLDEGSAGAASSLQEERQDMVAIATAQSGSGQRHAWGHCREGH